MERNMSTKSRFSRDKSTTEDFSTMEKQKKPSLLPPKNGDTLWDQLTKFYLIPEGHFLRTWNRFMVVIAIVNAILATFMAAFQYRSAAAWVVSYLMDVIFLADVYIKFHVAYLVGGFWVVFPKEMAVHYVRSPDFIYDVLINFPVDFIAFGWYGSAGPAKLAIIRLWKVLRVGRVMIYFRREEKKLHASFTIQVAKFVCYAIVLSHVLACIWFANACSGVIDWPMDITPACKDNSWVLRSFEPFPTVGLGQLYINSLYWTVVTMTTLGYGDIRPSNTSERVFAVFTVLSGVIFYGYINGTIASTLSNMDSRRVAYQQRLDAVKQYMTDRAMDPDMKERVLNYYDYVWERNRGIDVRGLFVDMPSTFKQEVALSLNNQIIDNAIIFKECSIGFRRMIAIDMKLYLFTANEYVVHRGDLGLEMYFITQGRIDIYATDDLRRPTASLIEGAYFGEFCVVLGNRHEYSARAVCNTDIYVFTKEDLERAFAAYPADKTLVNSATVKRYEAHLAAKRSRGGGGPGNRATMLLTDIDDLEEEFGVKGSVMKGDHPVHLAGGKTASIRELQVLDGEAIGAKAKSDQVDLEIALPASVHEEEQKRKDSLGNKGRRMSSSGAGYMILDKTMATALSHSSLSVGRKSGLHRSQPQLAARFSEIKSSQNLSPDVPPIVVRTPSAQNELTDSSLATQSQTGSSGALSASRASLRSEPGQGSGYSPLVPPRTIIEQPSGELDLSGLNLEKNADSGKEHRDPL
ncbi:uncharacterized protein SPPG_02404 [Spizellomyces punctatus DAOM BR117]|uniref:Cyclic nucleotide-binding domain-containing protein n=1 Tax=Spizellomyces punctatus (strain DAOM BR117) TaxID=645134 RepID=A0A0L0HPN0_SPIPD|nr:uncharacterized protein SPPG_02404 [Spizellomyces punctatus DAOM BR117]KND03361.1 hypothetical protein SPPG_02404 [Spizellomyces punctatus DAOM BR117]|eukprot:XP_016611400.1 hypothetical protein SPPG_02404 [Spizellomyces punctatus DAOM BR117]